MLGLLPHLALAALLSAKPADLPPRLDAAWHDLFERSDARAAAKAADAVLAEAPGSAAALQLSYVAHWMLDDEATANRRFLDLAAQGGPSAAAFLLDGWGRLRTSENEGQRIAEIAKGLMPKVGAARGALTDLRARTTRMSGDLQAAHAMQDALGRISHWQLIGPFENDQNSGYDVAYPPERAIDLAASYPGKQAQVSWRQVPGADNDGRVCLSCLLYPGSWGVAYLASWVRSDRARDVIIRAEADDHLKVWLNSKLAIADDTARSMSAEQHLAGVHLHAGWNQLLVKVAQRGGDWLVGLRFTDAAGAPLAGLEVSDHAHRATPAAADEVWPAAPPDPIVQAVEADQNLVLPAGYLTAWRLFDEGYFRKSRAAFETLAREAPNAAVYAFGAAVSALRDEDRDHGLSDLANAARLDPGFARARAERAEVYLGMSLNERAEEQAQGALELHPDDPLALDVIARLRSLKGYSLAAEELLAREERAHPGLASTALARAEAARAQGNPLTARNLFREAHHRDLDGWAAIQGLYEIEQQLGHPEAATKALEERRASRPQDVADLQRLAQLAAAYRQDGEARRWIAEAEKLCPQWDAPHRVAGYLAERAGDKPAALADYGEALERDPSDAALRDHLEILRPPGGVADRYLITHEEILKRAAAAKPEDFPGADAVVLLSQEIVRINADGSSRHWMHLGAKVFDQVGADRYLNRHVGTPENFKLLYAGTIDPDGLERESSSRDGAVLHFPAPSPGSVVELRYSYDEPRASATEDDYWGYYSFGGQDPTEQEQWVLISPEHCPTPKGATESPCRLHVWTRSNGPKDIAEHDETAAGENVKIFEERDIPRLEAEPASPPWVDVQDVVFASTLPSWERVAAFVHAVVDDQVIDDETVRDEAKKLTAGKATPEDKVSSLARFVAKEIRYNQADTNVYTWRPHPAGRVLASRYGDCKDKATLFIALAREVGLRAEFAALRTRTVGKVPSHVPVTWYNHAIAYLPPQKGVAKGRFIDLTADDLGPTYLPFSDQGVEAMVLDPGKAGFRFVTTPYSPAADDSTTTKSVVALQPDGSARAVVEMTAQGLSAMSLRGAYRNPTTRRRVFDYVAGRWLFEGGIPVPGSTHAKGLEDLEKPLTLQVSVAAPEALRHSGDALLLKPGGFPQSDLYTSQASRKLPMVLNAKNLQEVDWEYRLPAGVAVAQLPGDLHLDNRFFTFDATYTSAGDKVLLETKYRSKEVEVAAADYDALRSAMLEVARAADREIVLRGPPPIPPAR